MALTAAALVLKAGDKEQLEAVLRASSASVSLVTRARIVLLAAQGLANAEIARRVGVSGPTVLTWRARYRDGGVEALGDLPRSGWPAVHDEVAVLAATLTPPAARTGSDALVLAAPGKGARYVVPDRGQDLAQVEPAAVAGRDVQVLH